MQKKYGACHVFRSISCASGMRKIYNLCMPLATKPIGPRHTNQGCFILAAAPTAVYPAAGCVCNFGCLLGFTSNVKHCPPVTSNRTLSSQQVAIIQTADGPRYHRQICSCDLVAPQDQLKILSKILSKIRQYFRKYYGFFNTV